MRNRCRRCFCMNNNYTNTHPKCKDEAFDTSCDNVCECDKNYNKCCNCGFDDDEKDVFPENPMLAQSYVPIQTMDETFKPCVGLKHGTIFPELISPYAPGDSMKQLKYLEMTNSIGEGCNSDGRR